MIAMQPETLLAQLALRAHLAERNEGDDCNAARNAAGAASTACSSG